MDLNFSPRVRTVLYIFTAIGSPVAAYLLAKGVIGQLEMALWAAEVTATTALAAFNVNVK